MNDLPNCQALRCRKTRPRSITLCWNAKLSEHLYTENIVQHGLSERRCTEITAECGILKDYCTVNTLNVEILSIIALKSGHDCAENTVNLGFSSSIGLKTTPKTEQRLLLRHCNSQPPSRPWDQQQRKGWPQLPANLSMHQAIWAWEMAADATTVTAIEVVFREHKAMRLVNHAFACVTPAMSSLASSSQGLSSKAKFVIFAVLVRKHAHLAGDTGTVYQKHRFCDPGFL